MMSNHAPYQTVLPAPECDGITVHLTGELAVGSQVRKHLTKMAGCLQFSVLNVHEKQLKLSNTFHNDLKSRELTAPRKVYFCVKASF